MNKGDTMGDGYYESTGTWYSPSGTDPEPTYDGGNTKKTFEQLSDEVYDIIESMMDNAESEGLDAGAIVSLMLSSSLDPLNGHVNGVINKNLNPNLAMRNTFIMFCIALLQENVPSKSIKSALTEAIMLNNKSEHMATDAPV